MAMAMTARPTLGYGSADLGSWPRWSAPAACRRDRRPTRPRPTWVLGPEDFPARPPARVDRQWRPYDDAEWWAHQITFVADYRSCMAAARSWRDKGKAVNLARLWGPA